MGNLDVIKMVVIYVLGQPKGLIILLTSTFLPFSLPHCSA